MRHLFRQYARNVSEFLRTRSGGRNGTVSEAEYRSALHCVEDITRLGRLRIAEPLMASRDLSSCITLSNRIPEECRTNRDTEQSEESGAVVEGRWWIRCARQAGRLEFCGMGSRGKRRMFMDMQENRRDRKVIETTVPLVVHVAGRTPPWRKHSELNVTTLGSLQRDNDRNHTPLRCTPSMDSPG